MEKKPFGGYSINFSGQTATLEQVFGTKPITPAEMTSALWKYVKHHDLASK